MRLTEENYVEKAENVIKKICGYEKWKENDNRNGNKYNNRNGYGNKNVKQNSGNKLVTTSKIRNLLAMTAGIYNRVVNCKEERLSQDIINDINYLKIRFVYETGREETVGTLVKEAELLACIEESKKSRQQYILFSRYMEALVAYRKYYGEIVGQKDE